MERLLVVIPAYNEEKTIGTVITDLKKAGFNNIAVIDDGSFDNTGAISNSLGASVLSHPINIGLGGALSTGLNFAKENKYNYVLTVDADGQHLIADAIKLKDTIITSDSDVIIGSRLKDMRSNNKIRHFINNLADLLTSIFARKYLIDTQSGLRGFSSKAINQINIDSSGYECSSEILIKASKLGLKVSYVDISSIYTQYSIKKGQKILNSINVFLKLLINQSS